MQSLIYHSVQFGDTSFRILDLAHRNESETSRSFRLARAQSVGAQGNEVRWTNSLIVDNDDLFDRSHLAELVFEVSFSCTNRQSKHTEHIRGIRVLGNILNLPFRAMCEAVTHGQGLRESVRSGAVVTAAITRQLGEIDEERRNARSRSGRGKRALGSTGLDVLHHFVGLRGVVCHRVVRERADSLFVAESLINYFVSRIHSSLHSTTARPSWLECDKSLNNQPI